MNPDLLSVTANTAFPEYKWNFGRSLINDDRMIYGICTMPTHRGYNWRIAYAKAELHQDMPQGYYLGHIDRMKRQMDEQVEKMRLVGWRQREAV